MGHSPKGLKEPDTTECVCVSTSSTSLLQDCCSPNLSLCCHCHVCLEYPCYLRGKLFATLGSLGKGVQVHCHHPSSTESCPSHKSGSEHGSMQAGWPHARSSQSQARQQAGLRGAAVLLQPLSCAWLCDPRGLQPTRLPFLHCLLEFAHIHVHWVGDTVQPPHPLRRPVWGFAPHWFPCVIHATITTCILCWIGFHFNLFRIFSNAWHACLPNEMVKPFWEWRPVLSVSFISPSMPCKAQPHNWHLTNDVQYPSTKATKGKTGAKAKLFLSSFPPSLHPFTPSPFPSSRQSQELPCKPL